MTADDYAKVIEAALAMKPTPGPWHWEADKVKNDPTGRVRYQVTTLGKTVTRVYYSSFEGGPTNAEADAALIAACNPVAMRALLDERKAMKRHITRALEAWDTTPLPASGDGMLQERMECLRALVTTTADNHQPPKGP
jgi:hypothetical protein